MKNTSKQYYLNASLTVGSLSGHEWGVTADLGLYPMDHAAEQFYDKHGDWIRLADLSEAADVDKGDFYATPWVEKLLNKAGIMDGYEIGVHDQDGYCHSVSVDITDELAELLIKKSAA